MNYEAEAALGEHRQIGHIAKDSCYLKRVALGDKPILRQLLL